MQLEHHVGTGEQLQPNSVVMGDINPKDQGLPLEENGFVPLQGTQTSALIYSQAYATPSDKSDNR